MDMQEEISRLQAENEALRAADKAKRSASAKKAAATRKLNKQRAVAILKDTVRAVVRKHEGKHFMQGGDGVSCFVWVNGTLCASSNSLVQTPGFTRDMNAIEGVRDWHVNLD